MNYFKFLVFFYIEFKFVHHEGVLQSQTKPTKTYLQQFVHPRFKPCYTVYAHVQSPGQEKVNKRFTFYRRRQSFDPLGVTLRIT